MYSGGESGRPNFSPYVGVSGAEFMDHVKRISGDETSCQYEVWISEYEGTAEQCRQMSSYEARIERLHEDYDPKIYREMKRFEAAAAAQGGRAAGGETCYYKASGTGGSVFITGSGPEVCGIFEGAQKLTRERDAQIERLVSEKKEYVVKKFEKLDPFASM